LYRIQIAKGSAPHAIGSSAQGGYHSHKISALSTGRPQLLNPFHHANDGLASCHGQWQGLFHDIGIVGSAARTNEN